jgi:hypothetical protein
LIFNENDFSGFFAELIPEKMIFAAEKSNFQARNSHFNAERRHAGRVDRRRETPEWSAEALDLIAAPWPCLSLSGSSIGANSPRRRWHASPPFRTPRQGRRRAPWPRRQPAPEQATG